MRLIVMTPTCTALFLSLICLPSVAFSATTGKRGPSGVAAHIPGLQHELSPADESDPQWDCGSCTNEVHTPSKMNSLVNKFARYDALFESVINNATHHGPGAGYNLRFKLFF
jgi:hypothetical protein